MNPRTLPEIQRAAIQVPETAMPLIEKGYWLEELRQIDQRVRPLLEAAAGEKGCISGPERARRYLEPALELLLSLPAVPGSAVLDALRRITPHLVKEITGRLQAYGSPAGVPPVTQEKIAQLEEKRRRLIECWDRLDRIPAEVVAEATALHARLDHELEQVVLDKDFLDYLHPPRERTLAEEVRRALEEAGRSPKNKK